MNSYYDILEISENATKQEIKKQFRKLVRMYHPDVNSSFEAEQKFKDINRAAEILLDDIKKQTYDNLRKSNTNQNREYSSFNKFSAFKTKKQEDIKEKIINGDDITINVTISLHEAVLGTYRTVNITHSVLCPKCKGHKFANGKKCQYCNGQGEKITNKKITVKIPSMIKNKAKLRIKNEGKSGKNGGKNGNLYIIVEIENKQELYIKDNIVYFDAKISPAKAVLGGNLTVPTLWGEAVIKIPPLTKTNQSFKLIDVGILNKITGKKGEQIVKVLIQIPTNITSEEFLLYEKLNEINQKRKNAKTINS